MMANQWRESVRIEINVYREICRKVDFELNVGILKDTE